jgi:hypothetical protein
MSSVATASMMSADTSDTMTDDGSYRSVSLAAVMSVVLFVIGLSSLVFPVMVVVPVAGLVASIFAIRNLRRFRGELTGMPLAVIGLIANLALSVGSPAYHARVYATEVPEGFERISFGDLKSPMGAPDVPPQAALLLDGKRVFLKGYIHPSTISSANTKNFILVPDFATCCFGGQPPLTHMIEVTLTGDLSMAPTKRRLALAGVLRVDPQLKPISGLQGVYYQMRVEHIK